MVMMMMVMMTTMMKAAVMMVVMYWSGWLKLASSNEIMSKEILKINGFASKFGSNFHNYDFGFQV